MNTVAPYDITPAARLLFVGAALAALPLLLWWWRQREAAPAVRLRALLLITAFLTFDLVLFGAFTRLSDSGLGCPDWPGCYGEVSPLGARADIDAAQSARPHGPVTTGKAWIEMLHRYLATAVGALISLIAWLAWRWRHQDARIRPGLALLTLLWVILQGAFGALTVSSRLVPAIVTLHLLGGLILLVLLLRHARALEPRVSTLASTGVAGHLRLALAVVVVQLALGAWVSSNYAVLACTDFPTCQGRWWPEMDFSAGFTVWRPLGQHAEGGFLPFAALTAIHFVHRVFALLLLVVVGSLAWRLWLGGGAEGQRAALRLTGLLLWQFASGIGNAVLGWPLLAALAHTGGATLLLLLLADLSARQARQPVRGAAPRSRGVLRHG